mmetsp:Transcript_31553/g.65910  ORF Transcript_31553/g.65910 Transcript_31553/m.65910 type:complete len:623 (-) Transcript_31553:79-1947(-)|eukprot:CAMPEP_0172465284 /NCGR_PEP_ID=MMETSP1065-20121228/53038_1 /TAXON_ID=265537 /ORGANISM="Amphiprora paludosa, Strain CCMP125" /LENGTH=622 /DNA_ID=CAMNT_0013221765 /DNA_START=91 /DNA_END=1959 /DNA_ORIENTATION=-
MMLKGFKMSRLAASRIAATNRIAAARPLSLFSNQTRSVHDRIGSDETDPESGEWEGCNRGFMAPISIKVRGTDILSDPLFNKGTAFKTGERDRLRFRGMLPAKIMNIVKQKENFLREIRQEESNIKKNRMLEDLHDLNETLYHRVLVDHIEEMAPLIYTPTVGQACLEFGMRWRRPRGMYFTAKDRGHMAAMVYNWPHKDVHVIVVTDGSRILGLGDLGASGMGIPIGKLSLYCAAGGIAPHRVLPVVLDVGTDNESLLNDPYYLGADMKRIKGPEYFELVDEFMQAVRYRWPKVLVQFEDFNSGVAQTLLDKYRDEGHLCFNDDIQGTGATALAGILSALRAKGEDVDALGDQRILIAGAGSAGIGIAQVLQQAMMEQGRTAEEAKKSFFIVDQNGLLGEDRRESMNSEQKEFLRSEDDSLPLIDVITKYKPTILIGVTAVGGLFTEKIVREMAAHCERPVIFPLSNPTIKAECSAEQAYEWTDGRCVFASGSPFDSVEMPDGRNFYPSQCNNMYIFPGLGLGATVSGAQTVSDRMLYVAAVALAKFVSEDDLKQGMVFPSLKTIREVSHKVAVAVVEEAIRDGVATKLSQKDLDDVDAFVARKMYYPEYVPLVEKRELEI